MLILAAGLVLSSGCGSSLPKTAPVGGRVTYNGKPVVSGTIVFQPAQGRPAMGDIQPDGSLDYDEEILKGFDFVIASIHSGFTMKKDDMEKRIMRAMENPYTTMLGHPTGRLLLSRDGYECDMVKLIDAAARNHVIMELNASPYRLDIDWRYLKYAKDKGVMISINPDAHGVAGIGDVFYGVGIARKGWQERKDVLNTQGVNDIKDTLKRLRDAKRHQSNNK